MNPRARALVVVAAGCSGAATLGSATGVPGADRLLRGGLAASMAFTASTAPTWAVTVLATGAAAAGLAGGPVTAATGVPALGLAVLLVARDVGDRHLVKAASGALAASTLLRVPGGRLGVTAAVTGALAAVIVLAGLRRGSRRWRRRALLATAGLLGLGTLASVVGVLAGLTARSSFERSSTQVEAALTAARAGDQPRAAESARLAAAELDRARGALGRWWARPGWAVPVLGAHLRAADRLAGSAGPAAQAAAGSAEALRLDVLRPAAGQLDLDRLGAAEPQLRQLSDALHGAQDGASDARSPWLVAPFQQRLDRYDAQLAEVTTSSDRALLAVRTLPGLLGRDRPTRWFVAVANPAESRELGGFTGEFAILVADRGSLRLDRAGPVTEISPGQETRSLQGLELPDRYRRQRPDLYWQNLTGAPDLPTVASAARALWDQATPGSPLDGVVYIDPHGLAALLQLTGPVTTSALGEITAENANQLLLVDQYTRFDANSVRKDALREVAEATFGTLATAPLPAPRAIGAALGPAVRGGHLLASSFSPEGQRLFDEIGAAGRLPAATGGDLASLRTTNLVANKLDAHLRRDVRYQAVVDPRRARVQATVSIELHSDATTDLPDYVAANSRGLPKGTDLLEVAWYSGLALEGAEVDGRPLAATADRVQGWWAHSVTVEVPPGGTTRVVLRLSGPLESTRPYRLAVAPQAAASDDRYALEVTGAPGWVAGPVPQPASGRGADLEVIFRHEG